MQGLFEIIINCLFDTNSGFFYLVILTLIDITVKFVFRRYDYVLKFFNLIYLYKIKFIYYGYIKLQ